MNIDFSEARSMKRFPFLDAARGVACAGVVACHSDLSHLFLWYWGVMDFFFAMSGLLITRSLVSNCDKGRGVFPFLLYRALRLLPAYLTMMVLYEITFLILGTREPLQTLPYVFFYQHTDLIVGSTEVFHRIPEMEPYWSLILEEQYYLLWGIFFCVFAYAKLRINLATLGAAALLLVGSMLLRKNGMHEWTLPARFDGFLLGSIAGMIIFMPRKVDLSRKRTNWLLWLGGLACLASFIRLVWSCLLSYRDSDLYFQGLWIDVTCFSVFSLALVLGMMKTDMRGIHFGKTQNGLAFLGLVSYEIYLVHVPIITILKHYFRFNFDGGKITLYLVTMVLSTLVAYLMHRLLTAAALKKRENILSFVTGRLSWIPEIPARMAAMLRQRKQGEPGATFKTSED